MLEYEDSIVYLEGVKRRKSRKGDKNMFDFTLKYFFKEIKKNISMIGVIELILLLSLIT